MHLKSMVVTNICYNENEHLKSMVVVRKYAASFLFFLGSFGFILALFSIEYWPLFSEHFKLSNKIDDCIQLI